MTLDRAQRRWHGVSGGVGSWLAAKVDMDAHPDADHRFVFADTLYEDADCYRFLVLSVGHLLGHDDMSWVPAIEDFPDYRVDPAMPIEEYVGNPEWRSFLANLRDQALLRLPKLTWLVEGRDIWEIMRDEKLLGNSRFDPCSKIAKRRLLDRWMDANADPANDIYTIGIGPHEKHRFTALAERKKKAGWTFTAPLIGEETVPFEGEVYWAGMEDMYLKRAHLDRPRLYLLDYIHNNCGGFCIKAGHSHWLNRLRQQPDRFHYDAMMEAKLIAYVGGKVQSILSDRRGDGLKKTLTLSMFAARYVNSPDVVIEMLPGESGCGCAVTFDDPFAEMFADLI